MKRRDQVVSIAIVVLVWSLLAAKASDEPGPGITELSAAQVVEKYIRACGGTRLSEIRTEVTEGTLVRFNAGAVPLKIVGERPGKWHYNQTFAMGDQVSFGFDGADAWVQDTRSIEPMEIRQRLDFQLMFDPQAPLKVREWYPEMEIKGAEKIGDKDAVTVVACSGSGVKTELAFDAKTGLLLRAGAIKFEDYRDVGGIQRPFLILLGQDEGEAHLQMKMKFTGIQHNIEVDDALFTRPACLLTMKAAPLYKKRKEVEVDLESLKACVGVYRSATRPALRRCL